MGGRLKRKVMYVHMRLIHFALQQKLMQHLKQLHSNNLDN